MNARRTLFTLALAALLAGNATSVSLLRARADAPAATVVTAQILDYEKGFVFFTTGDGFRVSPAVRIAQYPGGTPTTLQPAPRLFARVTFAPDGTVTELDLSRAPLPLQGDLTQVHRFAVALSTPLPNPDLVPKGAGAGGTCSNVTPGKRVAVTFTVEVPTDTAQTDQVYMTTDQSGWNPQAYRMDRIDALHYRITLRLLSGTVFHYLFDRGSSQSIERGENGLEQPPRLFCVGSADAQAAGPTVYAWGDDTANGTIRVPQAIPTPYNPAPFPNLPTPHP